MSSSKAFCLRRHASNAPFEPCARLEECGRTVVAHKKSSRRSHSQRFLTLRVSNEALETRLEAKRCLHGAFASFWPPWSFKFGVVLVSERFE